ncbi:MAG: hypothetical protein KatS3mg035_1176 [Bacteroidia bacterium]|nr:MAG: hypothetical protein KatS3mg035_1176 [Bacteroidia bacterium]
MRYSVIVLLYFSFAIDVYAQITYNLEVEQSVVGNELVLDFMVERPAGSTPFAFGSSNFSVFVNAAALNIPGMYKVPAFDGPWDNNTNPTNYFDLSVGHNNSNYVNMNINYILGSPGSGSVVPVGRTRIGRIHIPITDPTQCNSITWRIAPLAIKQHDGSSIKQFANFINSTFCLPLCSNPPIFTQATSSICNGQSYVFATQNASTCSLIVANGTANVQITSLDSASCLLQFSGEGDVTLRFTSANGCSKDTIVQVHPNPQIVSINNLCSGDTVQFTGNSNDLNWFILGYDTTLSFSDTMLMGNSHFTTLINGYGSFTLALENTTTDCIYDTLITIRKIEIAQAQPIILCYGDTFTVSLNHQTPVNQWIIPNGLALISGGSITDSFAVVIAGMHGSHILQVSGLDENTCTFSWDYMVTVDTLVTDLSIQLTLDSVGNSILVANHEPVYWYFNDTLLSSHDDTLWISQPGNYYAVYMNSCGVDTSNVYTFTPTSKLQWSEHSFILYPNPNQGSFYVHVSQEGEHKVRIYDGIGKLVYQNIHQGKTFFIQLENITEGVYTLEIEGIGVHRWIYKR